MFQAIAAMAMQVVGMFGQNEQRANQLYEKSVQRSTDAMNALESLNAGTVQLANTKNGRILSSLDVARNQRKAEADEIVNAAVAGAVGTSVEQVRAQQQYNAAAQTGQLDSYFSQQYSAALDQIESAGFTLSSSIMPPFKSSTTKFMKQHFMGPRNVLAKGSPGGQAMNSIGEYD